MFLYSGLSPFHISASPSGFSANINEKIGVENQQKTTCPCCNHVYKVIAVYVANLTGLKLHKTTPRTFFIGVFMGSQHYFAPEMATIRYVCSLCLLYPAWLTKICRYKALKLNEKIAEMWIMQLFS